MDILQATLEKQLADLQPEATPPLPPEPPGFWQNLRALKRTDAPPAYRTHRWQDLDTFRKTVAASLRSYMAEPDPDYMLLIPAPPGSGKTWAGVDFAHWVYATTQHRVLYAGPRKTFVDDILQTSTAQGQDTGQWYAWLTRQKDDQNQDLHTCNYPDEINVWMQRGYEANKFCGGVCGWKYVNDGCPYHKQKKRTEPLIYGHHLHVINGHALMDDFAVIIGDESPLGSFVRDIIVPTSKIYDPNLPYESSISLLLNELQQVCESGRSLHGRELIDWLGQQNVYTACAEYHDPESGIGVVTPAVRTVNDAEKAPYNFLPDFFGILRRESNAHLSSTETYIARLWTGKNGLTIQTRNYTAPELPSHVVWFDATGTAELYKAMFQRPVQVLDAQIKMDGNIYQVVDRSNGKGSLITTKKDEEGEPVTDENGKPVLQETSKAIQLKRQIDHISAQYERPALIVHKSIEESYEQDTEHFYGARGTNRLQGCDVLIVAGTPMPPFYQIVKMAAALFPERMRLFDTRWWTVDKQFNFTGDEGEGYTYPVSQFADPELNIFLWQMREAEIIQAAHRSRMLFRGTDVDVYLLTNIPIDELPPSRLLHIRELFGAPEGVDVWKWTAVVEFADLETERKGHVTVTDFVDNLGVDRRTASKYMDGLIAGGKWQQAIAPSSGGRPSKSISRLP